MCMHGLARFSSMSYMHAMHFGKCGRGTCPRADPNFLRSLVCPRHVPCMPGREFGSKCLCVASAADDIRVENCVKRMDTFLGLSSKNRWSQFIDGRDHGRGPKAYDLKASEIDNVTLFVSGPSSHGSWLDNWFRGYSYLLQTCAVQLSVPLMIALFVPLYLGESEDALMYSSSQQQKHLWRNRPLGSHFIVADQESPGMGIDALMVDGEPGRILSKLEVGPPLLRVFLGT